MFTLNFTDFGYPDGKQIALEGKEIERRSGGTGGMILLFAEQHNVPAVVEANVANCLTLDDLSVIDFVGLEHMPDDDLTGRQIAFTGDRRPAIKNVVDEDFTLTGQVRFGRTVRAFSRVKMSVIESDELIYEAETIEAEIKDKHVVETASRIAHAVRAIVPTVKDNRLDIACRKFVTGDTDKEFDPETAKRFREEFGEHEINERRDDFMAPEIQNRLAQAGGKAVILNAGAKHIPRIIKRLKTDVQYIWVTQD